MNSLGNVKRIAAPRGGVSEVYYALVSSTWRWLALLFVIVFIVSNALFASVYMIDKGGIQGSDGSFFSAYFFSVQSMSTIGYGTMSPTTLWTNIWVTIEVMFGIVLIALTTGIVFAKFARPTANVLFSDRAIITRRNGNPALMLRVANAREGALVAASMQLSILRTDITDEGDRLRRLLDLKLVRSRVPFFTLSWSIIHEIDAESPLYGLTAKDWEDDDMTLITLLTGHDGDYGTTVYAQRLYYGEDLRWGHRFVDVLSNEERQITINYSDFHKTCPMKEVTAQSSSPPTAG
ncbi:MAG: inward rectifier potassium channel [Bradymonadia bacterium]|jgi:inward rectifier potassium channel